jgi:tetratricopeptide (TPR) repeat protein
MSNYTVARIEQIDEMDDGRAPWRPVRHHMGITSFGINSFTGKNAGDRLINEHDEDDGPDSQEELYVVQSGHARFELDGTTIDAPAGTLVFAKPGVKRTAFAEEPETTLLAIGGTAGQAYEPAGWEVWAPVNGLYQAGEYAEAADRGLELMKENPQYPLLAYNVACCESLAGRTEQALEHLRAAVEASPRTREFAEGDSDLDPIRDEPAFKELMGIST